MKYKYSSLLQNTNLSAFELNFMMFKCQLNLRTLTERFFSEEIMRYLIFILFLQVESRLRGKVTLCEFECEQIAQDVAACLYECVDCKAVCNEEHKKEQEYCNGLR